MDKVPGIKKNLDFDPDDIGPAESDDPDAVVDNLPEEMIDDAWDTEVRSWAQLGLNPGQSITIDQFLFKSRLEVLIQMLVEQELIDMEEMNKRVRRYMLKTMIALRKEHQKAMLQAKLMEGVRPQSKSGMFLPPGMSPNG